MITTYAIKTGRVYTAVTVDTEKNECEVQLAKPQPGGVTRMFMTGLSVRWYSSKEPRA